MERKDTDAIEYLLDNALGIMMVFQEDGRVLFLNETGKRELGYQEKQICLKQVLPGLLEGEKDISLQIAQKAGREIRLPVYRANMTCFPGRMRYAMTRIENGKAIYLSSIVNLQQEEDEVNELAKLDEKVKENMKSRNEFVANITHELRTPVNGIKGHIENLKAEETDEEKRKTLDIVLDCCENMRKIINNLLDFSKIEAGKFEIAEEPFLIRECINHAINTSMMLANEKGIKLSCYISEDVPDEVVGDELRLMQVLNNLISNAVKFTTVGYVRVEVYNTMVVGNEIELTIFVIDTGIGVTLEEKERMFKSFSQVDGSITRQYGGTGLGLYVSKQLVELMHGHIDLESEKGKGTTFQFNVKLKISEETAKTQQEKDVEEALEEKNKIVEKLRESMKRYQEESGIEQLFLFGSEENKKEIRANLEKLSLCIEMRNWSKSEQFAENVKKLCEQAPKEVKGQVFKMLMAIRKEDYEKSMTMQKQLEAELTKNE
ncbi:MAG: sensor histidine kinase [Roseburia sp.]